MKKTFLEWVMALPSGSGIYEISNRESKHRYIGQAQDIRRRAFEHYRKLEFKTHPNYLMQKEYRMHGRDAFKVRLIERCEIQELSARERFHIDKRRPAYNIEARRSALADTKLLEEATNRRQANKERHRADRKRRALEKDVARARLAVAQVAASARKQGSELSAEQKTRLCERAQWHARNRKGI